MATATVKNKTLKQKTAEAKDKMKSKISKAKQEFKDFKARLKEANQIGYKSGANDYDKLPKGRGVRVSATAGYNSALKDSAKREKLSNKLGGTKNGKGKK